MKPVLIMEYTENPLLEDDKTKQLFAINLKRYQASARMWKSIIHIMSFLMGVYIILYWVLAWRTQESYPFIAIDPTIAKLLSVDRLSTGYALACLFIDIFSSILIFVLAVSGIVSNKWESLVTVHWRITFICYALYIVAVISRCGVLGVVYVEIRGRNNISGVIPITNMSYKETANIMFAMSISLLAIVSILGCGGFTLCSYKFQRYHKSTNITNCRVHQTLRAKTSEEAK